ncbi:RNA polymerase factor sigma-32 [Alsobacter metallidurans]|uniref:RNA polymerase factor sigma-32 n=1 Tax=Alsobacter metallidurans TaxID=340221 RepID=A0A917ICR5_9HYPH|nr:RNA polymerase factor sigma-32 [Alsobacter metallidurans]GGH31496.1 RNA polymerase factor sigma-32 [Alsobacter metallidurans]
MGEISGVRRTFVKAAMDAPFLSREEEHGLAVRWKDCKDQVALHKLASAHMRLVIAIAARFRHYGLPMADLIQEGHVGLLEAGARFEPEREVRFSTYATWWIRASIQDYILRNWSIVRGGTSSAQKALFFNLRRIRARLSQSAAGDSTIDVHQEIATAVGVSRNDVALMEARLSGSDMSLNAPLTDNDSGAAERVDFLVDNAPLPDEAVGEAIDSERRVKWLRSALTVLSERELNILRERRLSEQTATLESLGDRLGISKERVRQIESRALEKLRRALLESHPEPSAVLI